MAISLDQCAEYGTQAARVDRPDCATLGVQTATGDGANTIFCTPEDTGVLCARGVKRTTSCWAGVSWKRRGRDPAIPRRTLHQRKQRLCRLQRRSLRRLGLNRRPRSGESQAVNVERMRTKINVDDHAGSTSSTLRWKTTAISGHGRHGPERGRVFVDPKESFYSRSCCILPTLPQWISTTTGKAKKTRQTIWPDRCREQRQCCQARS